jgi:hypothetical protein
LMFIKRQRDGHTSSFLREWTAAVEGEELPSWIREGDKLASKNAALFDKNKVRGGEKGAAAKDKRDAAERKRKKQDRDAKKRDKKEAGNE